MGAPWRLTREASEPHRRAFGTVYRVLRGIVALGEAFWRVVGQFEIALPWRRVL